MQDTSRFHGVAPNWATESFRPGVKACAGEPSGPRLP